MSARKTERLLNLVICLLSTRRHLTVEQIRGAVPGYDAENDEAFRRMFERDKEELRELGIPLETGSDSVWEDEVGYRIARRDYELPPIALDADEAAALGLAARLWASAGLADAASRALLKLRAGGVEPEALPIGLEPRVAASEPAFAPLLDAVRAGYPVRFAYRRGGGGEPTERLVEPWGVVSWRGRWYVVGHDRDRGATRVFRLSRVAGPVRPAGRPGTVNVPPDVDLRAAVAETAGESEPRDAVLRVRPGAALPVRRAARSLVPGGDADTVVVPFTDPARLAQWLAGFGADVTVVDPPDARAAVVRHLELAAGLAAAEPAAS